MGVVCRSLQFGGTVLGRTLEHLGLGTSAGTVTVGGGIPRAGTSGREVRVCGRVAEGSRLGVASDAAS